jgi:hypothetical protein
MINCGKLFVVGMMLIGLIITAGAMAADASEEGPSPWDALWTGEGFPPARKAPANSPKAREENADLKACGCGWAKEIKYRAPSEMPVPDSVVAEWKKLPLTDERVINAWKAAYQRREWKAYLRGLSPCARAGLLAWQSRYEESESLRALMEAIAREAGKERTAEKAEAFAERWARAARDRVLIAAGYDPVLVTRRTGRRMNSGAQGKRRDGPRNEPARTGSDALVPEGKGGEIASSVPAEARVQTGRGGTWIASSVPAEVRVQNGHSGTWIARSVPAQIRARAQSAYDGGGIASSVPAEIRARAQSAYEQAYSRAYRAYLGASPAAGDPTASPLSAGGSSRDCNYPCPLIFPTDTPQPADTCCSCPAPSPCDSCGCDNGRNACRCREFPYVVFEPLWEECVDEDCICGENRDCPCTGRRCTATLVPEQRYGHACFWNLSTETLVFYEKSAECKTCATGNCLRYCNHCPGDTGTCTDNPYGWNILWVVDKRFSTPCTVSPVLCECS